ncbi:IS110 family RNA-guided transposase [Mobilicoccus massiliensis]|uniref:IS110 family transposase n=3 Tax=Mobilicoccus massiliensis TaxID=1522310 RepID=UPI00058EF7B8|nr:IS110 family transposase [Mobilicoccus massiliensis]
MITFGVDAHKRSHTIVAVDELGRKIATRTIGTTTSEHLQALAWAVQVTPAGHDRRWAIEDCRHMTRRLEADLLAAGEDLVRVPPKLMAHVRDSARSYGKSDPIDALAVARAALREPDLPVARLDGAERDIRLLVDHREALIRERTALVNRLRWHLHELDPGTEITARGFRQLKAYTLVERQLADKTGIVARLARDLNARARDLTHTIRELEKELQQLTLEHAPALLAIPGCAALTAAKIVGETAGIDRFTTSDAFASYNGTAPLPVWSSNTPRHRLSRTGNRQLNAAIHRIALTQARHHQPAKDLIKRRVESGKSGREALRVLKRHISRTVYQALRTDQQTQLTLAA